METTEPTVITVTQEHLISEYVVPASTPASISAPTGSASEPVPVPVEDVGPNGALYTPWLCYDAAVNTWSGEVVLDYSRFPEQQAVAVVTETSPQGQQLGQWALIPAKDQNGNWQKADGCCGTQSGGTIVVDITTHALASGEQRYIRRYRVAIPGAVPPAPQIAPAGGYVPDAPPSPPPGPPPADVDYARIQGMINTSAQHVVDNIKPKVAAAITEAGVMTEHMFAGGSGSAIVYQQLVNTSYTGALGALHAGTQGSAAPAQAQASEYPIDTKQEGK